MHPLAKLVNSTNYCTFNLYIAKELDSIPAALMLSELIKRYDFYLKSKSLIHLRHQEGLWFDFTQADCEQCTTLSRREQDSAIKKLEACGFIKKILYGLPRIRHFQINEIIITEFLKKAKR